MTRCQECGFLSIDATTKFCPDHGLLLEPLPLCPDGHPTLPSWLFCTQCGAPLIGITCRIQGGKG
jgi:hypothetical protein